MGGSQGVPEEVWSKIEVFQKKGGSNQFDTVVQGCSALASENGNMINEIGQIISKEEEEDNAMRAQYGPKWTRAPSSQLNQQYKTVIEQSRQKLQQAGQADVATT